MLNLILMIILWSISSFDYYLISFFMKYIPGNIYINASFSTIAEIVANMTSSVVYKFFGPKTAFVLCFTISAVGGILIAFIPSTVNPYLEAFFVLVAKFGISFAFTMVYLITPGLFPTELRGTVYGICNVAARFLTILSPILAEFAEPTPMLCYTFTSVAGLVASLMLVTSVKYD
jgi:hypothetical protein